MSWFTNIFAGDGSNVSVRREWGTGEQYILIQKLTTDLYLSMSLAGTLSLGGEFMRLGKMYANRLYKAHNKDSASLSFSAAWTSTAGAYFGGYVTFRQTANYYVQLTTQDGITEVGCLTTYLRTNAGVALVTIDGDKTLADLLPTAQQLVDAGTLASTVLIANGGTLNPTDRVWNQYNLPEANAYQLFSSSLSPGVHTVRLTVTGYKQAASTAAYVSFEVLTEWGSGLFDIDETLYYLRPISNVFTVIDNPVWEISHNIIPTGASGAEWIGHTGSLKFTELPTITVDGAAVTPAIGTTVSGDEIVFDMQFAVRHSETGSTDLGIMDISYTFDSTTGLTIAHTLEWLVAGTIEIGYPCMMTADASTFDRGRSPSINATILSESDGSYKCLSEDAEIWLWDYDGHLGIYFHIPDLEMTVNNWLDTTDIYKLYIWDNTGGWNKVYARRFDGPRAYVVGDIWQSEANYRIKWFSDGADNTLEHFWENYHENVLTAKSRSFMLTARAR